MPGSRETGREVQRTAELAHSFLGYQERWLPWHMWEQGRETAGCCLSASMVHRWLRRTGERTEQSLRGQWQGVENSGQFGSDRLWARLAAGAKRVVLLLVDTVTGVIWTTLVTVGEERPQTGLASSSGSKKRGYHGMTWMVW